MKWFTSLLTIVHLLVQEELRSLAAVVVLVQFLDWVEHWIAVFLVLVHSKILPWTEVLVLAVKLVEAPFEDVALGVAQLWVFVDVYVSVQVAQGRPQIGRSFHTEFAVKDENSPLLHELNKSLAEEEGFKLWWTTDIDGVLNVTRFVLVLKSAIYYQILRAKLVLDQPWKRFPTDWIHVRIAAFIHTKCIEKLRSVISLK